MHLEVKVGMVVVAWNDVCGIGVCNRFCGMGSVRGGGGGGSCYDGGALSGGMLCMSLWEKEDSRDPIQ